MTEIYKPKKSTLFGMMIGFSPAFIIVLIIAIVNYHNLSDFLAGTLIALGICIILPIFLVKSSYIEINGTSLKIVKVFFNRKNLKLNDIKSVSLSSQSNKSFVQVIIKYKPDNQEQKSVMVANNIIYDRKEIVRLIKKIHTINSSIIEDESIKKFISDEEKTIK